MWQDLIPIQFQKSPLFQTKIEFPWIYPVFSHLIPAISNRDVSNSLLFRTHRSFPTTASTRLFWTCQEQSRYIREVKQPTKSEVCPRGSVKQLKLSPYSLLILLLREPRFNGKQANCHSRSTKVLGKNKNSRTFKDFSMQQHLLIYQTYTPHS